MSSSNGHPVRFSRPDPDAFGEFQDEYLPVADLPRARALNDRLHGGLNESVVDGDFQLRFFEQTTRLLVTAVDLGNSLLPAAGWISFSMSNRNTSSTRSGVHYRTAPTANLSGT